MLAPVLEGARPGHGVAAPAAVIAGAVASLAEQLLAHRGGRVYRDVVALVERPLLEHVLGRTGGNQLHAARLLGLHRNTLRKRCRQLGLVPAAGSNGTPRGLAPARPR
jgi:DNA-binding protein Fis